ncbi:MAG: 2-hydroxyacyl-CoA dehydratase family protein [Oscillospiraceae bacterium]|nr:2-hydroxyacyl-CoA dehydratase family protein [Oscillospiraceae bacterium]
MMDDLSKAEMLLEGKLSMIDYICDTANKDMGGSEYPSDLCYWETVRDAHKNGKKLVLTNGPVPLEIIYALDCIPLCLDLLPSHISQNEKLTAKFINDAETRANASLCSLQKTNAGVLLANSLGLEPDAYLAVPIACDSARAACQEVERYIKVPSLQFDIPMRRDEGGARYIGMQFDMFLGFMEKISGKKLDWESVKYRMALYNRSAKLLKECSELRMNRPCPLSSHTTVWNELMNAMGPTEEMAKLLEAEIDLCKERADTGKGPCPDGEKHRVLLLHNLLWQTAGITSALEKDFGAVTVADGYCFGAREIFTDPDNKQACVDIMCRRIQSGSMAHGAEVSSEKLLDSVGTLLRDYEPDVLILLGNRGCRHVWAGTKMLSDSVQARYSIPMLMLDVDNTDFRYKSEGEIKTAISEYMDTVVNKK